MAGKRKRGRPTLLSKKMAAQICDRLAEGESLNKICFDEKMPSKKTVYNWLADERHADFLHKYICARERQAETFVDECIDIADYTDQDTIVKTTKKGDEYEAPDHEWIARSRLKIETRLKVAEKMAPRKYTPKQELSGPEGGAVQVSHTITPTVAEKLAEILDEEE